MRKTPFVLIIITGQLIGLSQKLYAQSRVEKFIQAAHERTKQSVVYDGAYRQIAYPMGDVPKHIGVCTDLVIRSYRKINIDLQERVHEDMKSAFEQYPSYRVWSLKGTDKNIDHRRVLNLEVFFQRHGQTLKVSNKAKHYRPGDLVTWRLPGNLPHIGIVSDQIAKGSGNPKIIHNIGAGPKLEDMLFAYPIVGHYRYRLD